MFVEENSTDSLMVSAWQQMGSIILLRRIKGISGNHSVFSVQGFKQFPNPIQKTIEWTKIVFTHQFHLGSLSHFLKRERKKRFFLRPFFFFGSGG